MWMNDFQIKLQEQDVCWLAGPQRLHMHPAGIELSVNSTDILMKIATTTFLRSLFLSGWLGIRIPNTIYTEKVVLFPMASR